MGSLKLIFRIALVGCSLFFSAACSAKSAPNDFVLVGSTPGDKLIKKMLAIPADTKVDFINWDLSFSSPDRFILNIAYGESQPNTLGFNGNGEKRSVQGVFSVLRTNHFEEVYRLESTGLGTEIHLAKLNENIFHVLTSQSEVLVGNGGWSYSLNRREKVAKNEILIASKLSNDRALQTIFDGRTPCQEIADEHPEMNTSPSCFKLKWRLILNRDPTSLLPTTYSIRKVVDNQPQDVQGNWEIIKGTLTNPRAIVYKIESDRPEESMSFLVVDDNILLFLNKNAEPYIGNKDFSFTLNRRIEGSSLQ